MRLAVLIKPDAARSNRIPADGVQRGGPSRHGAPELGDGHAGASWSLRSRWARKVRLSLIAFQISGLLAVSLVPHLAPPPEIGDNKLIHAAVFALAMVLTVLLVERPLLSAAFILSVSCSVELFQLFVPGRTGSLSHLAANGTGVAAALALMLVAIRPDQRVSFFDCRRCVEALLEAGRIFRLIIFGRSNTLKPVGPEATALSFVEPGTGRKAADIATNGNGGTATNGSSFKESEASVSAPGDGVQSAMLGRRILHVITRFIDGGADENTALTCNHQALSGNEVWLIHGRDFSERMLEMLEPEVERICLPTLIRNISPLRDAAALMALVRLFREIRPYVVHTHTSKAGILGRLASLAVPEAHVVHGVHILAFLAASPMVRLVYTVLERLAARYTSAFISVSPMMRDLCLEHGIGARDKHFVVLSGMDLDCFSQAEPAPDLVELRRRIGEGAVIAGHMAAFEKRKRHRKLIKAVAPVLMENTHIHLALAGDGPELLALKDLVVELGLERQVHFLGFRKDPEQFLAACDICLFASSREGLPRTVVQYAAAGKPILATDLPGIDMVVREGGNGHIVAADDFAAFRMRFEELALNASKRGRLARYNDRIDLSEWQAVEMVRRIEKIYG